MLENHVVFLVMSQIYKKINYHFITKDFFL